MDALTDSVPIVDDADHEPTPAEVEADKDLATQTAVAVLTGAAALAGVDAGAAAVALAPIALALARAAVRALGWRRVEHAAETLMDGAEAAAVPLDEFIDRAVADDRRHELFARTLNIAQDTALRNKRRALGRALAAGVMGDDARIDEELLFIKAIADIDEMHIRLLARMVVPGAPRGWSPMTIVQADAGLANGVYALFGTLQLHGLIAPVVPGGGLVVGSDAQQTFHKITMLGREFLNLLADDAS